MTIEAVLFDIDGTLVDSNDLHVKAWQEAFGSAGHAISPEAIHAQIGKGSDMLIPALLPTANAAEQDALSAGHGDVFTRKYLAAVKPFPGARDLVLRVHGAGRNVVLASSASKSELDHYVDLLDIRDVVDAATSADDVASTKPAPDIFATALAKLGMVAPSAVIAVGDSPYDVEAAAKAGIAAVALRSGKFPDAVLSEAGAVALYDDVADLLARYEASPLANR